MLTMEGCLTPDEASKFIKAAESIGFQHQGSRGAAYGEAFRDNDRITIQSPELADHLWTQTGLRQVLTDVNISGERAVGLNSNLRIYRYSKGQRFGRHVDDSVFVEKPRGETQYTLLLYLSSVVGGETIFYDDKNRKLASVAPQPGLALLHRHGDYCLDHEGAAVRDGVKYVLRSDVVFA
ncbi:hypothetical protein Ndes2526B_g02548 [Nannochloris sp. 'desiccata']